MGAMLHPVGHRKALKVRRNRLHAARHGALEFGAKLEASKHLAPVGFVAKVLLQGHFDESGLVAVFGNRQHLGPRGALVEPARGLLAGAGDSDFDSARIGEVHRVGLQLVGALKLEVAVGLAEVGRRQLWAHNAGSGERTVKKALAAKALGVEIRKNSAARLALGHAGPREAQRLADQRVNVDEVATQGDPRAHRRLRNRQNHFAHGRGGPSEHVKLRIERFAFLPKWNYHQSE